MASLGTQITTSTYLENMKSKISPVMQNMSTYLFPISMLIIIIAIILKVINTKNALTEKYYLYTFIIIIPIVLLGLYVNDSFSQISLAMKQLISAVIFIFGCIALWIYYYQTNSTSVAINYTMFIVFFLLILTTLSIIYIVIIQYVKNMNNWIGFFIELIFTLPCYFIDIIKYLVNDVRSTHPNILILFILEIILLLLYVYIPKYFNKFMSSDKTMLTRKVIRLDEEYIVSDNTDKFKNKTNYSDDNSLSTIDSEYNKNYSISFWYYLNPENSSRGEKNILYYGSDGEHGKPHVVYKNTGEFKDEIVIYLDSTLTNIVRLPNGGGGGQKWNHLVITYNDKKVDVWVNGVLEKTAEAGSIIFNANDKIVVGENGGKYGFIKNIRYASPILTQRDITTEYNMQLLSE